MSEQFSIAFEPGSHGISFAEESGMLVVDHVEHGSDAEAAGLQAGCRVIAVDGCKLSGMSRERAMAHVEFRVKASTTAASSSTATPNESVDRIITFSGPPAVALAVKAG